MVLEVTMSPNDDNPEEVKKAQKKYLWFGFGDYPGAGTSGAFNSLNVRADTSIFDKLLEIFGVKEKSEEKPEENRI
jgi:hypothetical protein